MHSALFLILQLALAASQAGDFAVTDEGSSRNFEEALRVDNPHLRPKMPLPETEGKGFGATVSLYSGDGRCRGTKLGTRLFLTAAHCPKGHWENGENILIEGPSVFYKYIRYLQISKIHIFPGFEHNAFVGPFLDIGLTGAATDLALIEVNEDTPGIPQAVVAPSLPEQGRLIAFGHNCSWTTIADDSNYDYPHLSRAGIASLNTMFITLKEQGCHGDSGSPLFSENDEVIGVKSIGFTPIVVYTRLDTEPVRAWLGQFLALSNSPVGSH